MKLWRWSILLLLGTTFALAGRLSFQEHAAVQESLSRVHPRARASWLRARGMDDSYYTTFRRPESTGLMCIGRWPWGPSWELAGRDTFLYLGSGSGVRILSISDSVHPQMLGQVNARGLVSQVVVQDSLLFVACGSWGAQVYSVSDPVNARELGSMDAVISDLCVKDTFCYTVGGDSLRIYNVASASDPRLVGAVQDSGDLVVVANGHAFSAGRWVMNIYNVTDPAHPTWANSRGGPAYAMFVRRNLLFCTGTQPDYMSALNITDPLNITQVSTVSGYGGEGLYVDDSYAFLSCNYEHEGLFIVDVSDSSHPALRDSINPEGVTEWDPLVPHVPGYGYLADDYGGLTVLDLHEVSDISEAWSGYKASQAVDVHVDGQRAYVANEYSGLQIIDIANPADPVSLGMFDTIGSKSVPTAVARDSFAFISMRGTSGRRYLRVLDVTDPSNPVVVAQESCFNPPEDYVLKDTFIYAAEANRFQVFNVARPREPVRVGSLSTQDGVYFGLTVEDTLAFLISGMIEVINVAQPANPTIVSRAASFGSGIAVRDTFVYVPYGYDTLRVFSAANPKQLRLLGHAPLQTHTWDVAIVESTAVVATFNGLEAFSLEDPAHPHWRAAIATPYGPRRVIYSAPYFYAAMWEAGVGIYSAESLGLQEQVAAVLRPTGLMVYPNPVRNRCLVSLGEVKAGEVRLRDVAGRVVPATVVQGETNRCLSLDLSKLAAGVYFVEVGMDRRVRTKFVKQ